MSEDSDPDPTGSEYLCDALVEAGVELLVGLPGTQTLPVDRVVAERDDIQYVVARHETAIPHVAWGHFEASRRMAATVTVPGPGETNAAHGLKNALDDNVPLVHVSPVPDPEAMGKHPIHELDGETFDHVVKGNFSVDSPVRLRETIDRAVGTALEPPLGPVRLAIPSGILAEPVDTPPATVDVKRTTYDGAAALETAASLLADAEQPLLYVGGGARRSPTGPSRVAELAATLDAPVAASYKGKGVYPGDGALFIGVTGSDLPAGARAVFDAADVVLALGTDFDGPNTVNWSLPMGDRLVHVDIDPDEIDRSYAADVPVIADVGEACRTLGEHLVEAPDNETWDGGAIADAVRTEYEEVLEAAGLLDAGPPIPTPAALRTVRDIAPRETIVTTDIGGHRIWSKNNFQAYRRDALVTAGSWAGMGVGLPSAVGAALAQPDRPVLTLTGDGSLMMCTQELHTAVAYNLDIVVVLFNDADYGIISKALPQTDSGVGRFSWKSPDWVALAEAYGCAARSVQTTDSLRSTVSWAIEREGPALVDVKVDPEEPTPYDLASYESSIDLDTFSP